MGQTPGSGTALTAHRATLLDAIRGAGRISRASLSREMGLNAATVTGAIRDLLADGLIVETGLASSTGGKPATLLSLAPDSRYALGVHLERTSTTYVIANLAGELVDSWERRGGADDHTPQEVTERIAAESASFVDRAGVQRNKVLGIGLVTPGPATPTTGIGLSSQAMRPWIDFPVAHALAEVAGLPIVFGNDATAAAVGEYWSGGMETQGISAAVYLGTGIGAGIIASGHPLAGVSGDSGEIGHVCVDIDGPLCWCGAQGCLEIVAGAGAVVRAARAVGLTTPGEFLNERFEHLARKALAGDPRAEGIFADAARYLAVAVQTLANLLDLDRVVLTGPGFAAAGELMAPVIRERLEKTFFARSIHSVQVSISPNASLAAAMGAAAMVLQSELAPPPHRSDRRPYRVVAHGEPAREPVEAGVTL